MIAHRSPKHQKLLTGFLAAVLVVAGLIAGMRFAPSDDVAKMDAAPIVEQTAHINISGEWIGTTTEDYGDEARYDYRIVFEQDGNELSGILYLIRNHERAIYTETRFSGTIDGDMAFYKSDEILVLENAVMDDLCLVQTTVQYEVVDGQEMLVGTWVAQANQQAGCETISGHVLLTRQPE